MGGSGYFLSCEEHSPAELVEQARTAEQAGFESLWISDHYHPWHDGQGQSPFVRSVISLPVETAVTCPLVRTHPAVIAQAAATAAVQLGGRFRLGVGTGEALNEHAFLDAGFDTVRVHQIGPGQQGCFGFYRAEVLPRLRD